MKRKILWTCVIIILYIIIGSSLPFIRQLEITDEYKGNFDISRFYKNDGSKAYALAIRDNDEARIEKIRAIENAKDKIILSSYRLRADEAGKLYIASLINAAKRGVEIDIILDGNTLKVNAGNNNYYKALDSFDNVTIQIYNPMRILKPWSLHGRMHDKYMIVDGKLAFLGGRNIEKRFLITDENLTYDWDLLVYMPERASGDAISQLTDYFYDIFNNGQRNQSLEGAAIFAHNRDNETIIKELDEIYAKSKNSNPNAYTAIDYSTTAIEVDQVSLISNPIGAYSKEPQVFYEMTELMLNAEDRVTIHTPYYIGNQAMYDRTKAIANNAKTTIFTNSPANNANLIGTGDLLIHKNKFKDFGLDILLNSKDNSYHGKAFMVDDNIAGIGSFNWDMRSAYIDTELMMVVCGEDFNKHLQKEFDYYEYDASRFSKDGEIINPSAKPYVEASFPKKVLSVLLVILLYPLRFLF